MTGWSVRVTYRDEDGSQFMMLDVSDLAELQSILDSDPCPDVIVQVDLVPMLSDPTTDVSFEDGDDDGSDVEQYDVRANFGG